MLSPVFFFSLLLHFSYASFSLSFFQQPSSPYGWELRSSELLGEASAHSHADIALPTHAYPSDHRAVLAEVNVGVCALPMEQPQRLMPGLTR